MGCQLPGTKKKSAQARRKESSSFVPERMAQSHSSSDNDNNSNMASKHQHQHHTADVIVDHAVGDAVIPIHEHKELLDTEVAPKRKLC